MITINATNIEYTVGDTFNITVSSIIPYDDGTTLNLIISKSETYDPIINKMFSASVGVFAMVLTDTEQGELSIGNYIYKMTVIDASGNKVTQKSGDFIVKWGA